MLSYLGYRIWYKDIVDIYVDILLLVISYFLDNERGGKGINFVFNSYYWMLRFKKKIFFCDVN